MKNNSNIGSTIWDSLSILAQNILAHVSITFDGASKSLHIDIIPADSRTVVVDSSEMLQEPAGDDHAAEPSEEPTLEELRARLQALEGDMHNSCEFEEPVATTIDFEDELFSFMSEIDLCEEDEGLIRIVKNHPAYKSFVKSYYGHEHEADELQIVKAFVRTMAHYPAEEDEDDEQHPGLE